MRIDAKAASALMSYFIDQTLSMSLRAIKWLIRLAIPSFSREKPFIAMFIAMSKGFESICDHTRKSEIREEMVSYLRENRDAVYNDDLIREIYFSIEEEYLTQQELHEYHNAFAEKASKNQQLVNYINVQSHVGTGVRFPIGGDDPGNLFTKRVLKIAGGIMSVVVAVSAILHFRYDLIYAWTWVENWFEGQRVDALKAYGVTATPVYATPATLSPEYTETEQESIITPEIIYVTITAEPVSAPVPVETFTSAFTDTVSSMPTVTVEATASINTIIPTFLPLPNNTISFKASGITGGMINVYSGPSSNSYRAESKNNVRAFLSTSDTVWYAGYDGDWLLVMYEKNSKKGVRVGYISKKKFQNRPEKKYLDFAKVEVVIKSNTFLTDDPRDKTTELKSLYVGDTVLFLAKYKEYAYIETKIDGRQARGFIPLSSLEIGD